MCSPTGTRTEYGHVFLRGNGGTISIDYAYDLNFLHFQCLRSIAQSTPASAFWLLLGWNPKNKFSFLCKWQGNANAVTLVH